MPRDEHPFKRFLDGKGLTQTWAVERAREIAPPAGISQSHLSEVLSGECNASMATLALLERIAGGKVKAQRMFAWQLANLRAAG